MSDLDALAQALSRDVRLRRDGDSYVLQSTRFDPAADWRDIHRVANSIVDVLSGMAKVLLGSIATIEVSGVAKIKDDGSREVAVLLAATAVVRARMSAVLTKNTDGKQEVSRPADPAPKWLELAATDDSVAGVLERLRDPHSWGGLYNIYEIIRDDVGGDGALAAKGWVTGRMLTRFRRTACSPKVLGRKARHGTQSAEPPPDPITDSEASELIHSLVRAWVDAKLTAGALGNARLSPSPPP
jgi:hypothetical protein